MANRLNVLDCELTCFQDNIVPAGQTREIIEFGVSYIDPRTFQIFGPFSLPVIPVMSDVSDYCTALTGWTYQLLKKRGTTFKEACRRLMAKHHTRGRIVIVDSFDELETIRAQCKLMDVEFPFDQYVMNTSALYNMVLPGPALSLRDKLARLGLEFEGPEHRGANDSFNLARLHVKLLQLLRGALPAQPGATPSTSQ